jgi:hypothetical protein
MYLLGSSSTWSSSLLHSSAKLASNYLALQGWYICSLQASEYSHATHRSKPSGSQTFVQYFDANLVSQGSYRSLEYWEGEIWEEYLKAHCRSESCYICLFLSGKLARFDFLLSWGRRGGHDISSPLLEYIIPQDANPCYFCGCSLLDYAQPLLLNLKPGVGVEKLTSFRGQCEWLANKMLFISDIVADMNNISFLRDRL